MADDVIMLGSITVRQRPEENFIGYTISGNKSVGKIIPFHVTDDRIDIRIGYAIFINGERDIRTLVVQKEYNTFGRLIQGLRLAIQPVPNNPRKLYTELRQAYPKDNFGKRETLHPTTSELDLNQGAGLSLFDELRKVGAEVGTRCELLGKTKKRDTYLCASFAKDNLWVPVMIYTATRILPIANGYTGS